MLSHRLNCRKKIWSEIKGGVIVLLKSAVCHSKNQYLSKSKEQKLPIQLN